MSKGHRGIEGKEKEKEKEKEKSGASGLVTLAPEKIRAAGLEEELVRVGDKQCGACEHVTARQSASATQGRAAWGRAGASASLQR